MNQKELKENEIQKRKKKKTTDILTSSSLSPLPWLPLWVNAPQFGKDWSTTLSSPHPDPDSLISDSYPSFSFFEKTPRAKCSTLRA